MWLSLIHIYGVFKPGDRLPNEYELAQRLGVGRSTVREAIKLLVSQNVLEIHRGNGTFVCEQTGVAADPLGLKFIPGKKKLGLDLCEIRFMICLLYTSTPTAIRTSSPAASVSAWALPVLWR